MQSMQVVSSIWNTDEVGWSRLSG